MLPLLRKHLKDIDKETMKKINEFLAFIETHKSKSSVITYKNHLCFFFSFIKKNYKMSKEELRQAVTQYIQLKNNEIKDFTKGWEKPRDNYSKTTLNTFIAILSSFYKYFEEYDLSETVKKLRAKTYEKQPVSLSEIELKKMLAVKVNFDPKWHDRDNILLKFLYATGCRRSEASKLKKDEIKLNELNDELIRITGKGGKERKILVPDWWKKEYLEFLEKYPEFKEQPYLFSSKNSIQLSPSTIYYIIKEKAKRAGVKYNGASISPHKLRSTFATHYLNQANGKIEYLQELLGHSDIKTTKMYASISDKKLTETKLKKI